MTIMYHPTQENPERLRVWDRELKEQKYFSIKKLGEKKARKQAEAYQKELDTKKKMRQLKRELPMQKLFNEDGSVKGLFRKSRIRPGRKESHFLSMQITSETNGRVWKEIALGRRTFEAAYKLATDWLLEQHGIESTLEIRMAFHRARRHYW